MCRLIGLTGRIKPWLTFNTTAEVIFVAKDSQIDKKEVLKKKSRGGPTMAESGADGESRSAKTQSGSRKKSGDDPK